MRNLFAWLSAFVATILIVSVRCYQICLRPILPAVCRFHPECSEYFILAVRKYGPLHGAGKEPVASAAVTRGTPVATIRRSAGGPPALQGAQAEAQFCRI